MQSTNLQKNNIKQTLKDFQELIETLARVEYSRLSSTYLIDFSELINIGRYTVHTVLDSHEKSEYNDSYMSTAIKWAIRNELRRRYKWYSAKSEKKELKKHEKEEVREAVYETILSIDELEDADNPKEIKDDGFNPEENIEFKELQIGIKQAITKLPERQRKIIEARFFKGKKLKDLAIEFEISASRLSRIIQDSLDIIKKELLKQELV